MPDPVDTLPLPERHPLSFTPPPRQGSRPATDLRLPHTQLSQLAPPPLRRALSVMMLEALSGLADVRVAGSLRAPPGTLGLFLNPGCGCGGERAFLLGREFAHVHIEDDGSLHATIAEPLRGKAIAGGWAEPHPLAGQPSVSPDTVMIYAPRDEQEAHVIIALVKASWAGARGECLPGA